MASPRTTLIENLKMLLPKYLIDNGINIKKNFRCLNPNHNDQKPSMTYYSDTQTVYCHGCGAQYDIFDLFALQHMNAIMDKTTQRVMYQFKDAYNQLADYMHVNVGKFKANPEDALDNKIRDFNRTLIDVAKTRLDQTDYLDKRGIGKELAKKYGIGYVKNWANPTILIRDGKKLPFTPRIIIPTGDDSYLARDTRPTDSIPDSEKAYIKVKQGNAHIFNAHALYDDKKPIYVVEGEFDALSVLEVTDKASAVALGSTSNVNLFCQTVEKIAKEYHTKNIDYDPVFLIATDNDDAGRLAAKELKARLGSLNYDNYTVNITPNSKDPNEELVKNRTRFSKEVAARIKDPDDYLTTLLLKIKKHKEEPQYITTGISKVDELLDGGLYPQLYVLGAVSSVGKTTFSLQIADSIARHRPIFYFSLETSRDELTTKNLSRISYDLADESSGSPQTARAINNGSWMDNNLEYKLIMKAVQTYSNYYSSIHIIDGTLTRPTANDIYKQMKSYKRKHPTEKPVVFVDYLQILKPIDDKDTDKEKITKSIAKFKNITSELDMPVFVISSFNRASYQNPVSMQSYKESGEIEYYADVLMGLQYEAIHSGSYDFKIMKDAMNADPRKIELVILKNRNGKSNTSTSFNYYPEFNYFENTNN